MRERAGFTVVAVAVVALAPAVARAEGATDVAGIPAALVDVHGPSADWTSNLEVVGHTDLATTPGGTALGNNGAPALIGNCAYVGRWHDYTTRFGVQIVDVSDPANPLPVGTVPDAVKNGAVAREIRAVDLPGFRMLVVMQFSGAFPESPRAQNNRLLFYTFAAGAPCTQPVLAGVYEMGSSRGHEFFLWLDPSPAHNVDGHPRVLVFATAPPGYPNVIVVDASRPGAPALAGAYDAGYPAASPRETVAEVEGNEVPGDLGTYAHSISVSGDGTEAYVSYWDGGFFTVDTSDFALGLPVGTIRPKAAMSIPYAYGLDAPGNTHSAVKLPGTNVAVVGDEVYLSTNRCPFGWMRLVDLGDASTRPAEIGAYRLAENGTCDAATGMAGSRNKLGMLLDGTFSMHNQTMVSDYAFATWYGGGLRVVDLTDPSHPAEVGAFVPQPEPSIRSLPDTTAPTYGSETGTPDDDWWVATWSYPIVRDGLIYVTDVRNGLYVLRPSAGAPFRTAVQGVFAEGNSNLGDLRPVP